MPDEMSVSRIVFDRDENHLPCSDADRDWLIAEVESLEAELKDDRGVRAVVMNEQYAELDGLPEKSMRIYEASRSLRQQVARLEAEALLHKTFGIDQRKEGMEAAVKAVKETDLKDCYPGEDLTIGAWNDCREQIAISIVAAIRAAAKEQA